MEHQPFDTISQSLPVSIVQHRRDSRALNQEIRHRFSPSRAMKTWGWAGLSALVLLTVGCQGSPPPDAIVAPTPTPEAETNTPQTGEIEKTPETAETPSETVATKPEAPAPEPQTPNSTTPAPSETTKSTTAQTQLPDTLVHQWEPMSNVLFAFGAMTLTSNQVQWNSGQASAYRVVSTETGYLLKLETPLDFYETTYDYIKLIPDLDASGNATEVEVAYYESEAQANQNEYTMFGTYFVE